ncbi:protein Hook homolog 3 [Halyomorpha halys]|uniref:protein Hook homolog 3 n=1 Tax=Halyomorpha halys TaxID=286706 RepID=UPI0006D4ECD1|nr:protein Hook homolog 3 [Halyomorpha halys]
MNKSELSEILFKWLQTFEVGVKYKTIADLTDGVVLSQVLNQIAPEWFTSVWMTKIKTDVNGNWRIKMSNLKKILEKVLDYYQEAFSQSVSSSVKPDISKIVEMNDPAEMGRMIQLILGCAVNCNNKQEYIKRIMDMEESEQRAMMECIQELDSGGALSFSASLSLDPHVEHLLSQLNAANLARERAEQRCHELDLQVGFLQEEKSTLLEERRRLSEVGGAEAALRKQIETLREEVFKLETSRDDYRLKTEEQEREISELEIKVDEAAKTAIEARQLKDELDILRETADKADKYEATLNLYKKKLEETGDLKRELKMLEAKNLEYLQRNIELEEEIKRVSPIKSQLDVLKRQVADLQEKLSEETKHVDKLQYDGKVLQDKLSAALREKQRLEVERDSLKETNEELRCAQFQVTNTSGGPELGGSVSESLISHSELRQKVARLEHENNMLRLAQKEKEEDSLSVVQNLLDDARAQVDKMWEENRTANRRIIQLEGELKEMSESGDRIKLMELQQLLQKERHKYAADLEEKETALAENKQVISLMTEKLNQKELEIQEAEERLKKYFEKVKTVAKAIEPNLDLSNADLSLLRNQLAESQKSVKELQKELEETRKVSEMEEKLITVAFHNLGQVKQREAVEQRLASLGHGQSFLARQRQPVGRRINTYNSK